MTTRAKGELVVLMTLANLRRTCARQTLGGRDLDRAPVTSSTCGRCLGSEAGGRGSFCRVSARGCRRLPPSTRVTRSPQPGPGDWPAWRTGMTSMLEAAAAGPARRGALSCLSHSPTVRMRGRQRLPAPRRGQRGVDWYCDWSAVKLGGWCGWCWWFDEQGIGGAESRPHRARGLSSDCCPLDPDRHGGGLCKSGPGRLGRQIFGCCKRAVVWNRAASSRSQALGRSAPRSAGRMRRDIAPRRQSCALTPKNHAVGAKGIG